MCIATVLCMYQHTTGMSSPTVMSNANKCLGPIIVMTSVVSSVLLLSHSNPYNIQPSMVYEGVDVTSVTLPCLHNLISSVREAVVTNSTCIIHHLSYGGNTF